MKRALSISIISLVLAVVGACATSEDGTPAASPDLDSDPITVGDAASNEDAAFDAGADADTDASNCSSAGWCVTSIPDSDLTFRDIWALPGRAFAVAESPTLGVKVLEWKDEDAKWSYIDDNTQNESGRGSYAGRIWAPSEDEVYYAVAPRTIYHGKRSDSPTAAWSWTYSQLENRVPTYAPEPQHPGHYVGRPWYQMCHCGGVNGLVTGELGDIPALGVFGTSSDDVYAFYANTIYHLSSDEAGARTWQVEYVADDRDRDDEQHVFLSATAVSRDDVWFGGGRGGRPTDNRMCPIAVRRTPSGYVRVADGVGVTGATPCAARSDTLSIGGAAGWLADLDVDSTNAVVGLKAAREVVRITADGDTYSAAISAPFPMPLSLKPLRSLSAVPDESTLWIGGTNLVARSDDAWDGGSYQISTISLNGGWLETPINRVRGSSKNDRWAVGVRYALHKTTP